MADIIVDGMTRVVFIPTIASASLVPTAAEVAAGTVLHNNLTVGGMEGFDASPGEVDNTSFGSRVDTKLPGSSSYSGSRLILKKKTGTDTVFDTLTEFGTSGYIGVRDGLDKDTAGAADQEGWNIYPIMTGDWEYMPRERNSVLRYWVATPITDEPAKNVTLT